MKPIQLATWEGHSWPAIGTSGFRRAWLSPFFVLRFICSDGVWMRLSIRGCGGAEVPDTLLEVKDLTMHYRTRKGEVRAVDGVSFVLEQGQVLGLVGESGCGKTSI